MLKKWSGYALAYTMWITSFLLWVWFMFKSRSAISGLLTLFYLDGSFQRMKVFQSFNQFYFYLTGLVWLILMIIVENYFREGVKKGNLLVRICKVIAPELLLLFAADAIGAFVSTYTFLGWFTLVVELILGAGMVWYYVRRKPQPRPGLMKKATS